MDPNTTLDELIDAAVAGDWDAFYAAYTALGDWLLIGGFPPDDPRPQRPRPA